MNEIAGDLSFSKALLYYYFPDKSQLYIAVMRKLANNYLTKLSNKITEFDDLKNDFIFQINIQHDFIVENYNFFDYFRLNEQNLPEAIWEIMGEIHQTETELLTTAIKREVDKGNIKPVDNPEEIIDLLLDALHGVRVRSVCDKKAAFPKREHLEEIRAKRLLLAEIFIRGLN